jgi:hypothetical protein
MGERVLFFEGQQNYTDFVSTVSTRVVQPMPTCDHCDAHVSEQFARVFASDSGEVLACPACSANAGIAEVALQRARGS